MKTETYAIVCGNTIYDCTAEYYCQPEEYDTNTAEGVDICSVTSEGGSEFLDMMSQVEIKELEGRILEELATGAREEAECHADHLHELRKDERLGL